MATIKQHNQMLEYAFQNDKHFRHILTTKEISRMTAVEQRYPYAKLPVCSHCEGLAYWHKDKATGKAVGSCPACGTITANPISFAEYYVQGYDRDRSVERSIENDMEVRKLLLDY